MKPEDKLEQIDIDRLVPGQFQPRRIMNPAAISQLAESIRANGMIEPIVIRPIDNKRFEIVAGERRWRAVQENGQHTIQCVIRTYNDLEAMGASLVENIQRKSLRPIEEARGVEQYLDRSGLTHEQLAHQLGWTRQKVTHCLRVLQLDPEVQRQIDENELFDTGHARAMVGLKPVQQRACLQLIVRNQWNVRQLEAHCRHLRSGDTVLPTEKRDPDIANLEDEIGQNLGAQVAIEHRKNGGGRLIIEYHDLDQFDGLLQILNRRRG